MIKHFHHQSDDKCKYLALKYIFKDKLYGEFVDILQNIPGLAEWKKIIDSMTIDEVQCNNLVFKDFYRNSFSSIEKILADYFVAKYLISYLFKDSIMQEDDQNRFFKILRFIAILADEFKMIHKFIFDYTTYRLQIERTNSDLMVLDNLPQICNDIFNSENCIKIFKFWSTVSPSIFKDIFKIDDNVELTVELINEKVLLVQNSYED
ncbi:unnamed protein product [Chironomus riparius]|uniref:Uncharacterized protein n=1 Tax=Chironomus riparius TaxID=315576 RepID=A0A9N9S4Q5_9DIPT|nr:unnamed protein product [Chironomus riparius]